MKDNKFLLQLAIALVGSVVFLFSTFSTISYVNAKHEGVQEILVDIKTRVRNIEEILLQERKHGK